MTRIKRAIEFAKPVVIKNNPQLADKETRIRWWKGLHPIEKRMILEVMSEYADHDLSKVEKLETIWLLLKK